MSLTKKEKKRKRKRLEPMQETLNSGLTHCQQTEFSLIWESYNSQIADIKF